MTLDRVRSGWMRSRDLVNSSGDPNTMPESRYRQAGSWCQRVRQSMKAVTKRKKAVYVGPERAANKSGQANCQQDGL